MNYLDRELSLFFFCACLGAGSGLLRQSKMDVTRASYLFQSGDEVRLRVFRLWQRVRKCNIACGFGALFLEFFGSFSCTVMYNGSITRLYPRLGWSQRKLLNDTYVTTAVCSGCVYIPIVHLHGSWASALPAVSEKPRLCFKECFCLFGLFGFFHQGLLQPLPNSTLFIRN